MRPDVVTAIDRAVAVRARLARSPDPTQLADEVEDALCEGYAQALAGDAWLAERERRLHELIDDMTSEIRGRDVRALVHEHGDFQRRVITLRRELESLLRDHDRLRAGCHAPSA